MPPGRQLWVVAHRWAGLTLALFTFVTGLTGAIIPWQTELQRLLAPERFVAAPAPGAQPLPWPELRHIAEARSGGVVTYLPLWPHEGAAASFSVAPRPGARALGFDEIVLDPYDGREVARDRGGNLADGRAQLIPFLYSVHFSLALGEWGSWLLGIAALIWTLDCFVGFYLSLPAGRQRWWRNSGRSWRVRWRASGYRLNFDLHRAGGLWLWPMLLVFAWSSVGMNLRPVYDPVMRTLTDYRSDPSATPAPPGARRMGWDEALARARRAARAATAARGLHIERERVLYYDSGTNRYSYAVRTERDRSDDGANSYFTMDGASGRLLAVALPTGEHGGNTIDYWLGQLHVAGVFGLPYRAFVSALGLVVAMLSVTGTIIWMRKRGARIHSRARRRVPRPELAHAARASPRSVLYREDRELTSRIRESHGRRG